MKVKIEDIKKLREETGAGIADSREALDKSKGDLKRAEEILKEKGFAKAAKKGGRKTGEGLIETYVHQNGRVASVVTLMCETDFVAKTDEFKHLSHEIAMQIAAMNPKDENVLLAQDYIRDPSKKISDLLNEAIVKLGENITIGKFHRLEIGK